MLKVQSSPLSFSACHGTSTPKSWILSWNFDLCFWGNTSSDVCSSQMPWTPCRRPHQQKPAQPLVVCARCPENSSQNQLQCFVISRWIISLTAVEFYASDKRPGPADASAAMLQLRPNRQRWNAWYFSANNFHKPKNSSKTDWFLWFFENFRVLDCLRKSLVGRIQESNWGLTEHTGTHTGQEMSCLVSFCRTKTNLLSK